MSTKKGFQVVSPVDGSIFDSAFYADERAVSAALEKAESAFVSWRKSPIAERAELVKGLADALVRRREELADAVAWSIGRPIAQADETSRFRLVTQKHVEATVALGDEPYESEPGIRRYVQRTGQGVHLSIAPWNYPLGLIPWLIVAPILAGNTVIFKHAEQTTMVGRILQEAYDSIGGPPGVLQTLSIDHAQAGALIASGKAKGVNFIGSVKGGLEVHRAAAGTLTHVHLELGGKDAAYIRSDADLGIAIPDIADGCFSNAGQSCCSVERIYAHDSIYEAVVERFRQEMAKWTLGNPITDNPAVGPVVRKSSAEYIRAQIANAVGNGATAFVHEQAAAFAGGDSCYVAPTLLTDVTASMSIMRDELFGPAACIQKVQSDEEAIALMNDSEFGLTASVWTQDQEAGISVVNEIDAGTVFVNRCDHADLYLPWGGQKMSGLGRGNGREGLLGVSNTKSFHLRSA